MGPLRSVRWVLLALVVIVGASLAVRSFATLLGFAFGWGLTGYLLWRAWPAVLVDLRRLPRPRFRSGRATSFRGAKGDTL